MQDSKRLTCSARVGLLAAVALASAVLVSGCGGGSSSPRTTTTIASTDSGSASTSPTLAFSRCMRAHGVPNFPDLPSDGMRIGAHGQTISVNGVSVNAPAFSAARQTCEKYMPHTDATPAQAAQAHRRGLEFASCMRSHGVPNFPDPKALSTRSGGNQTVYLPGINLQSPAVQAAAKKCGGGPKGP